LVSFKGFNLFERFSGIPAVREDRGMSDRREINQIGSAKHARKLGEIGVP
jgi:hypothetical protein